MISVPTTSCAEDNACVALPGMHHMIARPVQVVMCTDVQ